MAFTLKLKRAAGDQLAVTVNAGDRLFVLGANGTGKSSLMHEIYRANRAHAIRISAHRQTWLTSNAITLTPNDRRQFTTNIQNVDVGVEARWKEWSPETRPSVTLYDLVDAENVRARSITGAVDAEDVDLARTLSKKDAPIKVINELLRLSNIFIKLSIQRNEQVVASKFAGPEYSVAELSDGERNALLIAASVLTANEGVLILIDEPERHLHRSIISPLLTQLFAQRPDCAFIVSTHEILLPLDDPGARTLLMRGCTYSGTTIGAYDVDLVGADSEIDEALKKDILGARRKLLFVEGTEASLDKPLYSLLFPSVSVIPKSSFRDVENAVRGIRGAGEFHWVQAFGIIDSDARKQDEIAQLKSYGVHAIAVFSVESIYYHPDIQRRVATRHANSIGGNAETHLAEAKAAALSAISPHIQRLSERIAEKTVREKVFGQLPRREDIVAGTAINLTIDVASVVGDERARLQQLVSSEDILAIVTRYPVRETPALVEISRKLGFQNQKQYEGAVLKLLTDDGEALGFARSLFGTLANDIQAG